MFVVERIEIFVREGADVRETLKKIFPNAVESKDIIGAFKDKDAFIFTAGNKIIWTEDEARKEMNKQIAAAEKKFGNHSVIL